MKMSMAGVGDVPAWGLL